MLYSIRCTDRPDRPGLRSATRPRHLAYLESLGKAVVLGGPFLAPDGTTALGSLVILEAESQAAAEAVAAEDPYAEAGLFAEVVVTPFRIVILNPPDA